MGEQRAPELERRGKSWQSLWLPYQFVVMSCITVLQLLKNALLYFVCHTLAKIAAGWNQLHIVIRF